VRNILISIVAVLVAGVGWWGIYALTDMVLPAEPGALAFFYALLFLALTATFAPPAAYLNRRFAPEAVVRDPLRFLRHAAWGALCLSSWTWLQMHRALNVGFALIIAMMFVALEVLIVRMRTGAPE